MGLKATVICLPWQDNGETNPSIRTFFFFFSFCQCVCGCVCARISRSPFSPPPRPPLLPPTVKDYLDLLCTRAYVPSWLTCINSLCMMWLNTHAHAGRHVYADGSVHLPEVSALSPPPPTPPCCPPPLSCVINSFSAASASLVVLPPHPPGLCSSIAVGFDCNDGKWEMMTVSVSCPFN